MYWCSKTTGWRFGCFTGGGGGGGVNSIYVKKYHEALRELEMREVDLITEVVDVADDMSFRISLRIW